MNCLHELQSIYPPGEARAILRIVMEDRFGLSPTDLLLGKDTELSAADQAELEIIMQRLLQGEPVQYVLGSARFCGRNFRVAPGVLIPRPETEELVRSIPPPSTPQPLPAEKGGDPRRRAGSGSALLGEGTGVRLLDVGTGSGCIAVTLALKGYRVTAFDISPEALRIARENAERLGAEVDFRREDILHPSPSASRWDVIVSNPPYVCRSEANAMERNVLDHEPHLALFVPDDDPMLFYRAIVRYSAQHLASQGWLFFETNRSYCGEVASLMLQQGYAEVEQYADQFGNKRFVKGRKT